MAVVPAVTNATSLTLSPASQNVGAGDSFALSLRIDGLGNHFAPSLGAFDLDVNFDPVLAQFDSITFGDPSLGDLLAQVTPSDKGSSLNGAGSLNLFSVSLDLPADLDANQPAAFTLATLHFTALALGSSGFSMANVILGDANGASISVDSSQVANVNIVAQAVPEGGAGRVGALALGFLVLGHAQASRRQLAVA